MKSSQRLAHDIVDTSTIHAGLVHDITDTDTIHKMVALTAVFLILIFNKLDAKLTEKLL